MYIIVAIIAFGILIADHELGHFMAAKAMGVKVNEFSIGMGPALFKKQGKETLYALRLLPLGGYCAMEGEDEASEDERAFSSQKPWKKAVILVAGAAMNFLLGVIVLLILYAGAEGFAGNRVVSVVDGFKYAENGIEAGDTVYSIDGHRIYYTQDFQTYMSLAGDTVKMVVIRDGEKVTLDRYGLRPETYVENGREVYRYGLTFNAIPGTPLTRAQYAFYSAHNFVRMVWISLTQLFTGQVSVREMSGVVGIVDTINEVGTQSATRAIAFQNIAYLMAFIAVNLAVMNLLPIPALDGGRILFLVIDAVIEGITKKPVNPKYEAYIHAGGMVLLLGFMAFILVSDVIKIIQR